MENNALPPAPLFIWETFIEDFYQQFESFESDNSIPSEIIEEINSFNASDNFKADFLKCISLAPKNRAQIIVNNFKYLYIILFDEFKKAIKKKDDLFTYACTRVRGGDTEEEALQIYRKYRSDYSLHFDFLIERLSKQERFKPRLIALKEDIGWQILITCNIKYP